jgi:hypothetical protein
MSDLIERLRNGEHPVEVVLRPAPSRQALRDCVDRGVAHIKFTGTQGGTELSMDLALPGCELTALRTDDTSGRIRLVGDLSLNYVDIRCVADIDLESFAGVGHIELALAGAAS